MNDTNSTSSEGEGLREPTKRTPQELHAADVMSWAEDLVSVATSMQVAGRMTPAALVLWTAGHKLIEQGAPSIRRAGYVLAIDALIATPGAMDHIARDLGAALVKADPKLALVLQAPVCAEARTAEEASHQAPEEDPPPGQDEAERMACSSAGTAPA